MKSRQTCALQERLAKAAAFLENLDACGDPTLGKATEKRIIWRELLDRELQEFDEETEWLFDVTETLLAGTQNRGQT